MADLSKRVSVIISADDQASPALLSTRENARLFNEELGLKLPRAITSAISEMPALSGALQSLSGVILGAGLVEFGAEGLMKLGESIGSAYDKLTGFTDLEAEATKADKDATSASDKYTQSVKTRIDALITLNMTEAERLKFQQDQAKAQLTAVQGEIAQLEAQKSQLEGSIKTVPTLPAPGGAAISGAADFLLNRDAEKQIDVVTDRLHALKMQEQDLVVAVEEFGAKSAKAFGDDATKAAEKLTQQLVEAYGEVQKVLGEDKIAEEKAQLDNAGRVFAQAGINAGPLLKTAYTKIFNDAAVAFSTALMAKVKAQTDELKNLFSNIGFDPSQFASGLMHPDVGKAVASIRSQLGAQSEEERVRSTQMQQQGYDRLYIEQQIGSERENQLAALTAQLNDLQAGKDLTDQQRAEISKLTEEIQLMGAQSHVVATQLMHDFHDGLSNTFVDLITGTETLGQAFRKMATQILADLAKMVFETLVWKSVLGFLNNSDFFSALGGGSLFGSGGVFGGHAGGGPVDAGMPGMVGELGPELFIPNVDGKIVPLNQIGGAGGSGDTYITVNAPNADNGTKEQIASMLRLMTPRLIAQAVVTTNDYARRTR